MERRPLRGTDTSVSVLGLSVRSLVPTGRSPAPDSIASGLLRKARTLGVTVFDVSAGSATGAAQRWIGEVIGREAFILSPLSEEVVRAPRQLLEPALAEARARLGGAPVGLLLLRANWLDLPDLGSALKAARSADLVRHWGVALAPGATGGSEAEQALRRGIRLFRLPYNLLDRRPGAAILDRISEAGGTAFISDPHAQGLLDGSLVRSGAMGGPGPLNGPALAQRFAPVLELSSLTEDRHRTLPQAAVQFALAAPSVGSVLLDLTAPESLEPLIGALGLPPLEPAQLARLPARSEPSDSGRSPHAPSRR